jgi:SAM-dependent methyltransferase
MELEKLYRHRFDDAELPNKLAIWKVLCEDFFSKFVGDSDTVLDVGAGYCEFINNIRCGRRIAVDLNPRVRQFAASGVEVINESCMDLTSLADESADVVFMSNFLEHLPSKQMVFDTLAESRRILRKGGRLLILQPNVRLIPGAYWDFFDHHTPLTEHSLVEALLNLDMKPLRVIGRFLPYTTKSALPQWPILVRLYLKFPPVWYLLGKQSFIAAERA